MCFQLYKSTADYPAAKKMYDYYSAVHDCESPHFISLRSIVLARKQPRKMFVQANTAIKGIKEFAKTSKSVNQFESEICYMYFVKFTVAFMMSFWFFNINV